MLRLDGLFRTFKFAVTDIKAFLHRQRWKEALIFFCFVLLSLGFWVLQSLHLEYETEMSIPIKYSNVPADIVFDSEAPDRIKIHIRDKGSALLNYTLGQKFRSITVNLENLPSDENRYIIDKKNLEADIQKQILATTTLYGFEPQRIVIKYGRRKSKEVPVTFNGSVHTETGFLVSNDILITPSHVTVYASESVLDSIQEVKTSFLEVNNGKKTVTKNITLEPIHGANIETERVSVIIPIEEYTEKSLTIPIQITNIPDEYTIRTFPQTIDVFCNIPISKFNDLTEDKLAIQIPFEEIENNNTGSFHISLTEKPNWIKSYNTNPSKIEFLLEENHSVK